MPTSQEQEQLQTLQNLISRIEAREAVVGIIGLGYVGLPLALLFAEKRFPVIGFDVDPTKVEMLSAGESYVRHIGAQRVKDTFGTSRSSATTDFTRLGE